MNLEQLRKYKPQIEQLAAANGISDIRVFGSVARGDATDMSDVDLLVKAKKNVGWGAIGFRLDITDLLGCNVDVVNEKGINKYIAPYIMEDIVEL